MKKSSGTPGRHAGPLFVAIALLLCVPVYFVSYAALVIPSGVLASRPGRPFNWELDHYYLAPDQAAVFFWPLEQMDRRIRPKAWDAWVDMEGPVSVTSVDVSCTFGADEMTTEASFFEEPAKSADSDDSNPFDDAP